MRGFGPVDYVILVVYLILTVAVGFLVGKEQRNLKDYFLAGRSMNYFMVAISVVAALLSGITYLGAPSEAYHHDLSLMLLLFAFLIATPVTIYIFLPFFYNLKIYSAYEYLEKRFNAPVRTVASALFIIRTLIWLALATYAPALALEQVTGIPLWLSIIATGMLTMLYTAFGGMKSVIWTDVFQFFVLVGGLVVVFVKVFTGIPGGIAGAVSIAQADGKMHLLNWSLDPMVRATFWGAIIGGDFMNLVQLATDQVSIQRYISARNLKEARKSLWLKLWVTIPVGMLLYLSGAAIYAFYHQPGMIAPILKRADQILPYFVAHELPSGIPGILIAAIFAATMSTISSGLNSLSTVTLVDFYKRFFRPDVPDAKLVFLAKWLTVGYGLLVILLAYAVQHMGTLVEASNSVIGLVGGPLLGMFLSGMLLKRTNGQGTIIGWVVGVLTLLMVARFTKVSFLWYAAIGCIITFFSAWAFSLFFARPAAEKIDGCVLANKGPES